MLNSTDSIPLRGVRVHNLQGIDLDLPLAKLTVVTGVSGAGKSSLAFDTLYAEGQRRYVESFSTYARQFLERMEQPEADSIGALPPAIAVRQTGEAGSRRATLGSITEVLDALRLLFARAGECVCPNCGKLVQAWSPQLVLAGIERLPSGRRFQIGFPIAARTDSPQEPASRSLDTRLAELQKAGFTRAVVGTSSRPLADVSAAAIVDEPFRLVVVDRLKTPLPDSRRALDSLEGAFAAGDGACVVLVECVGADEERFDLLANSQIRAIDGQEWIVATLFNRLVCGECRIELPQPDPALLSFQSSLGACPACRGTGMSIDEILPKGRRSSKKGENASQFGSSQARPCTACQGTRLQPQAHAIRLGTHSLPELTAFTVKDAITFLAALTTGWTGDRLQIARRLLPAILRRLELLDQLGLGHLTLDRPLRTLSRGESQRARLAAVCGSNLVNVLYVLDEPTAGLHPRDTERLLAALLALRDMGNTVVAVEHEPAIIRSADHVIDLGPQAGPAGGRIVYQGPPAGLGNCPESATGRHLNGTGVVDHPAREPRVPTGWLELKNVRFRNLQGISVDFPLGVLCVVSGVSGSGKSSLVLDTLVPAIASALAESSSSGSGEGSPEGRPQFEFAQREVALDDVLTVDSTPISRSPRSLPAGIVGVFNEIRSLFSETAEAKVRNFGPAHFSFNAAGGGRCETCAGIGTVAVDMQFLPDVFVRCPDCHGTRYRREILDVKYRGLTIADVLNLTAQEAFSFFRGRTRIQRRLKFLKDVGLEYLRLGQSARGLSGGESQRLKLAAFLSRRVRARTLIVLEEPSIGLHPQDLRRLFDCWDQLLAGGHSLIVIEHNLDVIGHADFVIDLGPEAGREGGRIVATGPPQAIIKSSQSQTGRFLARVKDSGPRGS